MKSLVFLCVVCVASQAHATYAWVDAATKSVVLDNDTRLQWQSKRPDGLLYPGCTVRDAETENLGSGCTWTEALLYCEALVLNGSSDWRLPNIKELLTVVDRGRESPAAHPVYFPQTAYKAGSGGGYWSSTSHRRHTPEAYIVAFHEGESGWQYKTSAAYVRCVRGGI